MLLATLAAELTWGDPTEPERSAMRRSSWPVASTTTSTLWEVLERRPSTIWSPATLDERIANAYEQREVAERLGDRTFRLGAAHNLVNAATCRGDLVEVDKNLDVMIRLAAETGLAYRGAGRPRAFGVATIARRAHRRGRTGCGRSAPDRKPEPESPTRSPTTRVRSIAIRRAQGTPRRDHRARRTDRVRESRITRVSSGARQRALRSRSTRRRSSSSSSRSSPAASPTSRSISTGSPP